MYLCERQLSSVERWSSMGRLTRNWSLYRGGCVAEVLHVW